MKFQKFIDRRIMYSGLAIAFGAALLFAILNNLSQISQYFDKLTYYIAPVTGGLALAYVLRPFARFMERVLLKKLRSEKAKVHISGISTVILFLVCIYFLIKTLIPQLIMSITNFVGNMDAYIDSAKSTIIYYAEKYEFLNINTDKLIGSSSDILTWVENKLNELVTNIDTEYTSLMNIAGNIIGIFTELGNQILNLVIIVMMSIYALLDRKNLKRGLLKIELVVLGKEKTSWLNAVLERGDSLMLRFLGSNLLDAVIIGLVNFVFLTIFDAPYTVLLSVLLGVTNFVPTFGPIVGGVVGALIVLLTKPSLLIGFMAFTIVLQQIDGNVIKPVLFGDSTGISPFWVLFSIVVGGRMFGVVGMILGVPVFALLSSILTEILDKLLARKNMQPAYAEATAAPPDAPPNEPAEQANAYEASADKNANAAASRKKKKNKK